MKRKNTKEKTRELLYNLIKSGMVDIPRQNIYLERVDRDTPLRMLRSLKKDYERETGEIAYVYEKGIYQLTDGFIRWIKSWFEGEVEEIVEYDDPIDELIRKLVQMAWQNVEKGYMRTISEEDGIAIYMVIL